MLNSPQKIKKILDSVLPRVSRPGRYSGGELNQIQKDWTKIPIKVALAFPEIYDLGMSNYGLAILFDLINQREDALAERTYLPWTDMEEIMQQNDIPLYSLETKHPVSQFDILGISIPYETLYTNTLQILHLSNIPLFSAERTEEHPLVIAGGHAMMNPEPMHAFLDAVVIGEGEDVILEIIDAYKAWKSSEAPQQQLLEALSRIWGVYVPAMYQAQYDENGNLSHMEKLYDKAFMPVVKRIVAKLPPVTTKLIVPYIDTVHNRIPIEIMRGCTRGCRFCQAGSITRPVRERTVEETLEAIEEAMAHTGFEEVGLLSLSSSDYSQVLELVKAVSEKFGERALSISLPSLRIESFSVELMDALKDTRRSGFTLAPEAATERMREIINKPVSTEQLLETAREIYSRGWNNIKLYFMIGHPEERIEDVKAIADLCKMVLKEGEKLIGRKAKVTAGVSTFVPKPHTPFQWVPCDTPEQILAKQDLLKRELRGPGLKLNWNNPEETMLEAALSRGDRRVSEVIYRAWKEGAKFDAWFEHFDYNRWLQAFSDTNLDPNYYTHRDRLIDEPFPWDHISTAVTRKYLTEDYLMSKRGETRIDCRQRCFACGILPTFNEIRMNTPGKVWMCPEIKPKEQKRRAATGFILPEQIQSPD
jgi:radical SAM family uncharacterized protein